MPLGHGVLVDAGYDIVLSDFDGTIYHDGEVDPKVVEAFRREHEEGRRVGIVTGAGVNHVLDSLEETGATEMLQYVDFIATQSAAEFHTLENGEVTESIYLVTDEVREMVADLHPRFEEICGGSTFNWGGSLGYMTGDDIERRDSIAEELRKEFTPYGLKVQTWATGVGVSPVTKYDGLDRYFTEHEGEIPVALALGDSENDVPLFTFAKEHGGYAGQVGNGRDLDFTVDYKATAHAGAGVAEIIDQYRDMPDEYAL